jgi:hypothetical protein
MTSVARPQPFLFLRLLLAVALLASAFAHRPAAMFSTLELAAYALPDGSLPQLCIPDDGDESGAASGGCEFCRLAHGTVLPTPPVAIEARLGRQCGKLVASSPLSADGRSSLPFPARGPPATA